MESLYQNINLLFIDELVDSGMDANGVENAIAVLKKMGRERQKNIYLILHKEELASLCYKRVESNQRKWIYII